jgi:hypothetical protein
VSAPRRQLQRPVEVLQRFIVPAQARAQKASLKGLWAEAELVH